jgi:hypothetical protein
MKTEPNHEAERYRNAKASLGITNCNNGAFQVDHLRVIVSSGGGWDHVSVSLPDRCPYWDEMCRIKRLFFKPEEVVMQLHPAESKYKNVHKFCLHLWRPQTEAERKPILEKWLAEKEDVRKEYQEFGGVSFEKLAAAEEQPMPAPIPLPMEVMV